MQIQEQLKIFHENPVISWHEHIFWGEFQPEKVEKAVEVMALYGVDKVVTSIPVLKARCSVEECVEANDRMYQAMQMYPDKLYGEAFVDPGNGEAALREIERCADLGFSGVKLYYQYQMDDPVQFPVIEKCIDLGLFILMHSAKFTYAALYEKQPYVSDGVHMANAARRYPEATFLMAHIGGGGDWKWSVKAIQDTPNVIADIGGSVHDRPMIEETVEILGADRMVFATDGSWSSSISKILGAEISEEEKKTILAGKRLQRFLDRKGK